MIPQPGKSVLIAGLHTSKSSGFEKYHNHGF